MNPASQWRLQIANRIGPLYAANSKIAVVIVGGSTARGHADQYSDIELGVFWHGPPTDQDRQQVVDQSGADLLRLYPYDSAEQCWSDDFMIGRNAAGDPLSGILVEIVHYTVDFTQQTFDDVLIRHNPDELKQNLVAGIVDGLPLAGNGLVEGWMSQAAVYPPELAVAVVNRHAQIDHFWRWQMWQARGDNRMMLNQAFVQVQQKILHILLALNGVYYFGFKWLEVIVARLKIAPADLVARFRDVYLADPSDGARQLATIVDETYDLLETHMSAIDVARLRRIFHYARPIWANKPPLDPV